MRMNHALIECLNALMVDFRESLKVLYQTPEHQLLNRKNNKTHQTEIMIPVTMNFQRNEKNDVPWYC